MATLSNCQIFLLFDKCRTKFSENKLSSKSFIRHDIFFICILCDMKNILLLILLVSTTRVAGQSLTDMLWTHCATAKSYDHADGPKMSWGVKKPITFCYNDLAFGFAVGGHVTICNVFDHTRSLTEKGYAKEEYNCAESNSESRGDYVITIVYSSPASVTINYLRYGGYAYHFVSRDLPMVREKRDSLIR